MTFTAPDQLSFEQTPPHNVMTEFVISYSYTDPQDGQRKQSTRTVAAENSYHALRRFQSIFDGPNVTPFKVMPA